MECKHCNLIDSPCTLTEHCGKESGEIQYQNQYGILVFYFGHNRNEPEVATYGNMACINGAAALGGVYYEKSTIRFYFN